MTRLAALLCAVILTVTVTAALGAPGEDHWSPDPDSPFGKAYAEAKALIDAQDFAAALPILQKLAKDEPGSADVFNLLGFAYRKTGDLENSAPAYERALRLSPNHHEALEYQGELFLTLGDLDRAEQNLVRLNALCGLGCEEAQELAELIAAYKAARDQ